MFAVIGNQVIMEKLLERNQIALCWLVIASEDAENFSKNLDVAAIAFIGSRCATGA